MRRRRRLEITVETTLLVARRGESRPPVWCAECSSPVRSVTPDDAAALAGVGTRAVYRWVEAGRLHLLEAADRPPRICLDSLLRVTEARGNGHVEGRGTDPD